MTARPEALRVARRWIAPRDLAPPIPLADLAPLNRYAVEAHYPIGEEPLTGGEARAAIAVSRRVGRRCSGPSAPNPRPETGSASRPLIRTAAPCERVIRADSAEPAMPTW